MPRLVLLSGLHGGCCTPEGPSQASFVRRGTSRHVKNQHPLLPDLSQHLRRSNGDPQGRSHHLAILQDLVNQALDRINGDGKTDT